MQNLRATLAVLAAFALGFPVAAQAPGKDRDARIEKRLEEIRRKAELPALGAAYVTRDEVLGLWTLGTRRAGGEEAVTDGDLWHLGSCTKSMTATLIALLVARGDLRWDAPLGELLPDLVYDMHPDFLEVTLVELLCHRAGVVPNPAGMGRDTGETEVSRQRAVLVRELLTGSPVHAPGSKYLYSNGGYMIAGHAAEVATGKSWESLMQELLFEPLGMTTAGFGPPGSVDTADQPRGHDGEGKPVEPGPAADNPPVIGPAGTVHASLGDWARYVQLHLRGAKGDVKVGKVTLTKDTFELLHAPYEGPGMPYAFGWIRVERAWAGGDGAALWHNGSNTMWFCVSWLGLENGVAALAATNRFSPAITRALDETVGVLIKEHGE